MKKNLLVSILILLLTITGFGCGNDSKPPGSAEPVKITIAAAASLRDAGEELKKTYSSQHPEVSITYIFESSGTLQKQIEEGAPVDMFISAGKSQMDAIAAKGLIVDASRKDLLGNDLVLVAGKDSKITGFADLAGPGVKQMSIGTPETVPAGKYAQQALQSLKLWEKVQPKVVPAKDVRQVLTYVESGNVDAGLVYRSDTLVSQNVKIIAAAPAGSHDTIVYPLAIIKSTKYLKEVEQFAAFLSSDEATKVFEKYGFKPLKS